MTNSEPPEQCEALNVSWCYHPIIVRTSLLHLVAGLRAQGARSPCTHPQQVRFAPSQLPGLSNRSWTQTRNPGISEVRAPPAGPAQASPKRP